MKKKNRIGLYTTLAFLGVLIFIAQVFIFEKPDGLLGFIICLTSITTVVISIIQLCKSSKKIKNIVLGFLEALFGTP